MARNELSNEVSKCILVYKTRSCGQDFIFTLITNIRKGLMTKIFFIFIANIKKADVVFFCSDVC